MTRPLPLELDEWIHEFTRLSCQRSVGHDLNNYLTPLAMQVSMLKMQLQAGKIEKALGRINKLDTAVIKLRHFSQNLFDPEQPQIESFRLKTIEQVQETIQRVAQIPRFSQIVLDWDLETPEIPLVIPAKILALFCYCYFTDVQPGRLTVSILVQLRQIEHNRFQIILTSDNGGLVQNTSPAPENTQRLVERYAKIINSGHDKYQIIQTNTTSPAFSLIIDTQ